MKILVAFTGGTIGSSVSENVIGTNSESKRLLIDMYKKKYGDDTEFITAQPYYALSENSTGKNISSLISFICGAINNDIDGIIVTHGTDTLQYTAAALSYALGSACRPVVIASSNYVLTDSRANGPDNFKGAVDFIKGGFGRGVFVSYRNNNGSLVIHRACRLLPHNELSDEIFSIKNQYYGRFENGGFIKNPDYAARKDETKPFENANLSEYSNKIAVIQPYPGLKYPALSDNTKTVLIKTYHSGTICTDNKSFENFADELKQKKIPCYICGAEGRKIYESAKAYEKYGFTVLPPSSFISQYIKLWLALENNISFDEICKTSLGEDILPL